MLYIKKNNYNQNTDEGSNNLSTTSVNNCKTSENNVIRTTETPNKNDLINDNLAASTRKEKFRTNTASLKLGSTETELNKRKNSSPIIRELDTPVTKTVSSKPSRVDFDFVIDKPSKQESPRSSKTKNCPVIEVKQTVKHSHEQVNTRKQIQTAQTENIDNADNNTVQENNEEWRKGTTLILEDSTISGLIEKKMSRNRKIKVRYFPGAKIKDMYHYAIPLLEKKPENIILHLGTNDAPYKSDTDILKDLIELKDFILEKSPSCKRITLSSPTVRTDRENAKENNENFTNRLKKQGMHYITHDNITHKHLYRDGLHLKFGRLSHSR